MNRLENSKIARRHDLDHLRVLGTALVFLFHSIQPFNPFDHWHIQNSEQSLVLGWIARFLNIWLMPLFMLLAGTSAYYSLKKRTSSQFLKERVRRILIPLVVGILILVPPQVYWERLAKGQIASGFLEFYPHFFEGIYPTGNFSWHHLWFLAYLFVYSLFAPIIYRSFESQAGRKWIGRLAEFVNAHPLALGLLVIPSIVFQVLLRNFPQTNALVNDWAWHAQLLWAFFLGLVFVSNDLFSRMFQAHWKSILALAIVVTGGNFLLSFQNGIDTPSFALYLGKATTYRLSTWLWILGFLGIGVQYFNRPRSWLSYASTAVYPFYILHQTVIVGVAYYFMHIDLGVFEKFSLVFSVSLVGTLCFYEVARRTPVVR